MNKYHIGGKLCLSLTQMITIDINETLERKYQVDAKFDAEGKYIEQLGELYPEAIIEVHPSTDLVITKVDDIPWP
jgi:hypothetical protein